MTFTAPQAEALYKRSDWRKGFDQAKIEMGLMPAYTAYDLNRSLLSAVLEKNHRAVREMVALGADPDQRTGIDFGEQGVWGSLLHIAVRLGSLKTVVALLHAGADPFARDSAGLMPRSLAQRFSFSGNTAGRKIWAALRQSEARSRGAVNDDKPLQGEAFVFVRRQRETA